MKTQITDADEISIEADEISGHEKVRHVEFGDLKHKSLNDRSTKQEVEKVTDGNPMLADTWREVRHAVATDEIVVNVSEDGPRGNAQIEIEEVWKERYSASDLGATLEDIGAAAFDASEGELLRRLADCMTSGMTAAQALDYYAVDKAGLDASEWARMTDRDPSTVRSSVQRGWEAAVDGE
jgi:hypothetical protein